MKIPKMYVNVMCDNTILPFFVTGAPNVYNNEYLHWLFSGGTRKTITCTGPITQDQIDYLKNNETSGELLYKKYRIKFEHSILTDILERRSTPITTMNIIPRFHRPYEDYVMFYFLFMNGIGRRDII